MKTKEALYGHSLNRTVHWCRNNWKETFTNFTLGLIIAHIQHEGLYTIFVSTWHVSIFIPWLLPKKGICVYPKKRMEVGGGETERGSKMMLRGREGEGHAQKILPEIISFWCSYSSSCALCESYQGQTLENFPRLPHWTLDLAPVSHSTNSTCSLDILKMIPMKVSCVIPVHDIQFCT